MEMLQFVVLQHRRTLCARDSRVVGCTRRVVILPVLDVLGDCLGVRPLREQDEISPLLGINALILDFEH